jgi:hypothetical protein
MFVDPIVAEMRRIKEAHAAKYDHDIMAMFQALREQQQREGRKVVSFASERKAGPASKPESG